MIIELMPAIMVMSFFQCLTFESTTQKVKVPHINVTEPKSSEI